MEKADIAVGTGNVDFTEESVPSPANIVFGKTFDSNPIVLVTPFGKNPQNYHVSVEDLTTSGCNVYVAVDGQSTGNLRFYWTAIDRGI